MKMLSVMAVCLAILFVGDTVNDFSECPMHNTAAEKSSSGTQTADGGTHHHGKNDMQNPNSGECDGCSCQHCIQMNALPVHEPGNYLERAVVGIFSDRALPSREPETTPKPPERIS